ncbi:MAG: hypothetical protein QOD00_3585 [Blastocatellia bacterium]|jgi:hypothetical protein|nr:hypothetical protein [Blastocatellia bacterium]
MNLKELAAHYEAKVFETREAAEEAGYVLTETMSPRNTWNKASAASAIIHKLLARKRSGEADAIGLILDSRSVTGCYKKE